MMTRRCSLFLLVVLATNARAWADDLSPAERTLAAASKSNQFAFILFYRSNDARAQALRQTLTAESVKRDDAVVLAIGLDEVVESQLIQRFDATRTPMPAIVAVAPNGAITGVFPQRFTVADFNSAIVTPSYAECVKALQNDQLVLLCVQPSGQSAVPSGIVDFQANESFGNRVHLVTVIASDPSEAPLLKDLEIGANLRSPITVLMAPPGVMLGKFDARVTGATLAAKLAEAGKCCDDPNCAHGRKTATKRPARRR